MPRPAEDTRLPTMSDVAQLAGVSHQTVSRVLSGHPNVREVTRAGVQKAIDELGYRRNSTARALATRRTRTLGVVAADTTLFGPASTVAGLAESARAEGYMVSTVSGRALSRHSLTEALEHLGEWGVEGAVVITPQREAAAALFELRHPFPVVTVEGGHDLEIPSVSVDQHLGARLVTDHLLGCGHRTVWHVAGPQDWLEAAARMAGWRAALHEAGADVPPPLIGDWSPLSGYRAGQELAGRVGRRGAGGSDLTAVFASNDQMALGIMRAFREAGVRIPVDVAVAGFDDIPEAEFFAPPLTTVRQDFAAVGRASIRLLLDRIEGGDRDRTTIPHHVIEPQLIVRGSTTTPVV
ncbi:LacI family DNA-binding transcriptional regulator [Streptomyces sp. RKAG293]|uniref:LacI family DNA-binding transcriptional regulator n=1 Tax=Streptomyces sp. RKAG293 TaxID=2893403 RepID=UPI0035A90AD5